MTALPWIPITAPIARLEKPGRLRTETKSSSTQVTLVALGVERLGQSHIQSSCIDAQLRIDHSGSAYRSLFVSNRGVRAR